MSSVAIQATRAGRRKVLRPEPPMWDYHLIAALLSLVVIGVIMVASSSISLAEKRLDEPFYYINRQSAYAVFALLFAFAAVRIPLEAWRRISGGLLLLALVLLVAVLIPGIGKEVNGSMRWIPLGGMNFQVSEFAKLATILYLAGYLLRHGNQVQASVVGFLKPMVLVVLLAGLLLIEPDFGAAVVLLSTAMGMMFLGGARLWQFALLAVLALVSLAGLAISSPYRMARITGFLNPWEDPFNSGFQLTQALIAIGRGEWLGVGLGASIQKLFYLPEAHTDFVFSVFAEELGLFGVILLVVVFSYIIWRAFDIGVRALAQEHGFAAFISYGIGLWLGMQAFINMGVNMGLLPTKGLTLPLISYGGSSMLITGLACGLLVRADHEIRCNKHQQRVQGQ